MSGRKRIRGGGSILDKLPVELHIPGYNYCGPGTKLQKRLARGDKGINLLDEACKEHDIAYATNKDRHTADRILADKAKAIRRRRDIGIGQRIAAFAVDKAMRAKVKMGLGVSFRKVMNAARRSMQMNDGKCLNSCIKSALSAAKSVLNNKKNKTKKGRIGRKRVKAPRVLPVPNTSTGGIIPFLIPALAGLSAIGSLAGGASAIARTVNAAKNAQTQLDEAKRHNRMMEAAAIGKGLYLKPYKKGLGLFISKKNEIKLLVILPNRALSNTDLLKYVKKLRIPRFRGVFMRNTLPKAMWKCDECGIVNLDVAGGPGTHWVAYVKKKNIRDIYYFDSMGDLSPPEELQRYFSGKRVFYNFQRYQKFDSFLCGHLCLIFLLAFTDQLNNIII